MKTYLVVKAYPGAKLNAEVQMEPDDAAPYVADGFLVEKDAAGQKDADNALVGLLDQAIQKSWVEAARVYGQRGAGGGSGPAPFALSVPEKSPAEPKEEKSFGEFLQMSAWAASPAQPGRYSKACDYLRNKYRVKENPNFGEEFDATVKKGAGGFGQQVRKDGTAPISKASVQVESSGALGGFAVPVEYSRELFRLAGDQALFMGRVKRYTMTGKDLWIPALDYSKGGSGASPYLGGMNAGWIAENVTFPQENANLRQIKLSANLLAGYTQASRTLLADNVVALEQVLTDLFSKAIAFNVDYAIFTGDGIDKPKGMITSGACQTFQRGNWATNGVLLADLAKADSYLIPELEGSGIWVLPPSFKTKLYPMTDASGKVVFIPNGAPGPEGAAAMRPSMRVFGKDLFWSQLPASSGTTGDVNVVIPQLYAFGLREEIEIGVSEHVAFTTNLLTWRFLFRGDGASLLNTTLTLQNGDVVAPFVSVTT